MTRRPLSTPARTTVALAALALGLSACAGAPAAEKKGAAGGDDRFPVEVLNCGHEVEVTAAPEQVVTLNQGATEVVLALGLADQLAGTAYLDDEVDARWAADYDEVPVLAKEYPTNEQVLAAGPDLVYASYSSAFDPKVAGERDALAGTGVASYLSPFGCPDADQRPEPSFEAAWQELRDVAALLGHPEAADDVVAEQEKALADLEDASPAEGLEVVWWDGGTKTPNVGAGQGGPALVLDAVGADNVFGDLDGGWADGSWEDVLAADPDVIVLVDAAWDTAADKRAYLTSDPVLKQLTAVKEERFVVVPFSASTPGVRLVAGAQTLADGLEQLGLTAKP